MRGSRFATLFAVFLMITSPVAAQAVPVSGEVPISAPNGPTITLDGSTNAELSDFTPDDNTVRWDTDDGEVDFRSNGDAEATVTPANLTGDWTNVTGLSVASNDLTIEPPDKSYATVGGDADSFAFSDSIQVGDNNPDFVYAGTSGTTSVSVSTGVSGGTTVDAVDQSGTVLDTATANSNGRVTFSGMPNSEHVVTLQGSSSTTAQPQLDNPSPTGELTQAEDELSIDVDDGDFPNDEVRVNFTLDGQPIHSENITSAQTVTATIPQSGKTEGDHSWAVQAEDSYGNTVQTLETYTYGVPGTLFIRNETRADSLLDGETVNVTWYSQDTDLVFSNITNDGTVDMTGLPTHQYEIEINVEDNYTNTRNFYIDSIVGNQSVYVLSNKINAIESRFVLNDVTGDYPPSSVLYVSKAINQSGDERFRVVHSDEFGAEGVTTVLENDTRYRLRIRSPDGKVQDVGPYRSSVSETVDIQPGAPGVTIDEYNGGWGTNARIDGNNIFAAFDDPQNETDSVTFYIHEYRNESNQLAPNQTFYSLGRTDVQYFLGPNQTDKTWVVNYVIERNGQTLTAQDIVAKNPSLVPDQLDQTWRNIFGILALFLLGGAFSVLNRGIGAITVGLVGGVLWYIGWLGGTTTGAAIVVYLFMAVLYNIYLSEGY